MPRSASKLLLSASGLLFSCFSLSTGAALAGSVLENTQETTVGTQATYDNSWSQSFQVSGNAGVSGGGTVISPFAQVPGSTAAIPNSGTAVLNASVQICQSFCDGFEAGGSVSGSASISPTGAANSIILNSSSTNGVPAITLNPQEQPSAGFAANVIGDNIGTATLQTQGSRKSVTSNRLSVF